MKLNSMENGARAERFTLRTAILQTLGDEALVVSSILSARICLRAPGDAGSLRRGNFTYFPVVPGRMEFATLLRRLILHEPAECVAVGELPASLKDSYLQALARLPEMSVILYPGSGRR